MSKTGNININDGMKLTVQSTTKVTCNDKIIMFFLGGEKEELDVKIEANFSKLKPEHHEIFLQSFSSRYNHHTQIFNTHTNYDGSKVPTVKCDSVKKESWWKRIFKPKQR